MSIKLSVVIPCYNEQQRFKNGFSHYYSYLLKQNYKWEIIIVNDGSTDKTLEIIKEEIKNIKNIVLINYDKNKGKGFAIKKGVLKAKGLYILFADIDHSVEIQTIEDFIKMFKKGYSVVIGSRRLKESKILKHQNIIREILGRGFTFLVNLTIYPGIKDATCGFKAFTKNTANKIFSKITIYDWAFDAEILFIAKKLKLKIAQSPVSWKNSKGTKVSLFKDIFQSLIGIIKINFNDLLNKY